MGICINTNLDYWTILYLATYLCLFMYLCFIRRFFSHFTEHSLRNCVILHFLSFFILVIFNSSNTLLVRGVYIDAEENGEDCVEFPCYYFRLRFQVLTRAIKYLQFCTIKKNPPSYIFFYNLRKIRHVVVISIIQQNRIYSNLLIDSS